MIALVYMENIKVWYLFQKFVSGFIEVLLNK